MATTGSFTIGGASPDYATIQAWADAPTGNLTGIFEGLIRAGTYSENVDIDHAWTTTSSFYMKLGPDTGAHHGGVIGGGVVIESSGTDDHNLLLDVAYTRVKGIEVGLPLGNSSECIRINEDGVYVEECILRPSSSNNGDGIYCNTPASATFRAANNLIIAPGRAGIVLGQNTLSSGLTAYIYNNTVIYGGVGASSDRLVGIGSDGTAPAAARTLVLKNNYVHEDNTYTVNTCYAKQASDSWGASVDNASSDATAPGTSPVTSATLASQFTQVPLVESCGENTGDEYSGTTEACTLNKNANTTNLTSEMISTLNITETPDQVKSFLFRCDMTNFPAVGVLHCASLVAELPSDPSTHQAGTIGLLNRNWVEAEATWNIYSTGNSWGTVGALGAADHLAGAEGNEEWDPDAGSWRGGSWSHGGPFSVPEDLSFSGGLFTSWVKDAIDGTSPVPKGGNWIDCAFISGGSGQNDVDFPLDGPEDTDGDRPRIRCIYNTAAAPLDVHPLSSGVLDGVGTDLSADGNFAITTDLSGDTRIDSTWEIGAFQLLSEGVFTIGGTTPDYATVQAWADSPQANLTGIYEGRMRAGTYVENVDIDHAFTTTASNYMLLTADTGAEHLGVFGDGAILEGASNATGDHVLHIAKDYTRVIGITVRRPISKSSECIRVKADNVRLEKDIIYGAGGYQSDGVYLDTPGTSATFYMSNCIIAFCARMAFHIQNAASDGLVTYAYNNTIIHGSVSNEGAAGDSNAVGFGGTATNARTHNWINNYVHAGHANAANPPVAFSTKDAADSYGTSKNNSAFDTSSPGTSPQDSAAYASQFVQPFIEERTGENTADDNSGTTEGATLNKGLPTTNETSTLGVDWDGGESPVQIESPILRINMVNHPAVNHLAQAAVSLIADGTFQTVKSSTYTPFLVNRNWVEGQVTWNIFSTSNNWGTSGGLNASDLIEGSDGVDVPSADIANGRGWGYQEQVAGDECLFIGGKMHTWVADAIAGTSPVPKGGDWLDILAHAAGGGTWNNAEDFRSQEATTGNRPAVVTWYDTSGAVADYTPIGTGVLDGNGVDVGGDANYAIGDLDITGTTRDASWDIGAYRLRNFSESTSDGVKLGDSAAQVTTITPATITDGTKLGDSTAAIGTWHHTATDGADLGDTAVPARIHDVPDLLVGATGAEWNGSGTATSTVVTDTLPTGITEPIFELEDADSTPVTGHLYRNQANGPTAPADGALWRSAGFVRKTTGRDYGCYIHIDIRGGDSNTFDALWVNTDDGTLITDPSITGPDLLHYGVQDWDANWWFVWGDRIQVGTSTSIDMAIYPSYILESGSLDSTKTGTQRVCGWRTFNPEVVDLGDSTSVIRTHTPTATDGAVLGDSTDAIRRRFGVCRILSA